jgi:hypothetical protein
MRETDLHNAPLRNRSLSDSVDEMKTTTAL